jgi:DNA-binding transcriptional MerR regulator
MTVPITIGQMAERAGVPVWQLRQAIRRGYLSEPPRVGPYRVFDSADEAMVRQALRLAGYQPAEVVPA